MPIPPNSRREHKRKFAARATDARAHLLPRAGQRIKPREILQILNLISYGIDITSNEAQ